MYLIGDIGNTEIKLCILDDNLKINKNISLKTNLITKKYIKKKMKIFIKNSQYLKYSLFCSVVPKVYNMFYNVLKLNYKLKCYELKKLSIKGLIKLSVNRNQIGSDRLSNAISVSDTKNNYIVVDFGTATTFDVINKNVYLGGIIAPGVKLSLENLVNKASLIHKIKLKKMTNIIGKNTSSSVKSGFYWGYVGLVNNLIKLIIKTTKKKYNIILTGGLSNMFNDALIYKSIIDKSVTLKGLIKVIKHKKNEK